MGIGRDVTTTPEMLADAGWHTVGCWRCGVKVNPELAAKGNTKVRKSGIYNGSGNGGFWCNVCVEERPALGSDHWFHWQAWGYDRQSDVENLELGWRVWSEMTRRDADSDWIIRNRFRDAGHDPMWGGVTQEVRERTDRSGQMTLALTT